MTGAQLEPAALRSANIEKKYWRILSASKRAFLMSKNIAETAQKDGTARATVKRYLKRLTEQGVIRCHGGLYWRTITLETGGPSHRPTPL
jgi:DNA-binding Lrp family transcriptional regulator